jgi:deoxyadenosine/deoxycytidine kinase
MKRIAIEGNIGAGKTTQLDMLSSLGIPVFREPTHLWPLEEFYEDPERHGFLMQATVLASFADKGPGVYERSTLASKEVFSDFKTESEKNSYEILYDRMGWDPDYWIFLESDPDICYNRLKKRNGKGDSHITKEYINTLDEKYKNLHDKLKTKSFVVNADRPAEEIHQSILSIILNH